MGTFGYQVKTAAQAVRRAGWQRLTYEVGLALFCGLGTAVIHLSLTYDPPQDPLAEAVAYAVLGFVLSVTLIPLRLVRPLSALMICGLLAIPMGGVSLALVPLSAAVGYRAWQAVPIVLAYLTVLVGCVGGIHRVGGFPLLTSFLLGVMEFSAFVLLPGAVAAMVAQRRLLVTTMHQRNLQLHAERRLAVGQAQTRERNRIAAELHDSLGHRLTLISLYAGGLAHTPEPAVGTQAGTSSSIVNSPERQQALGLLRDTSAQAMGELRQILKILHQDGEGDGAGRSLSEVEETVASARGTGTRVDLARIGEPRPLPLLAEHAAYRVVQEGITNALKHAGGAAIRVEVRYDDDALFVEVRNGPGRPYEGQSTGQGLAGLAERVRLAGGVLSSGPLVPQSPGGREVPPDSGFRIGAILPYDAEVPAAAPEVEGDFPQQIARNSRRQRIGAIAVVSAIVLALGACIGSILAPIPPETVSQSDFDAVRVGDDEGRVRDRFPEVSWDSQTGAGGESCEVFIADDDVEPAGTDIAEVQFELCFLAGELVSKDSWEIPN